MNKRTKTILSLVALVAAVAVLDVSSVRKMMPAPLPPTT